MELKPAKGLKVKVNAVREVVFGEESMDVRKVAFPKDDGRSGVLTGTTIAGYCEVEMPSLDGKKHWYPIDGLAGEKGEKIVEEEIELGEATEEEETEDDGEE